MYLNYKNVVYSKITAKALSRKTDGSISIVWLQSEFKRIKRLKLILRHSYHWTMPYGNGTFGFEVEPIFFLV